VNYAREEKVIKISQEQFVPLINETEASSFYLLYNYVTSTRASADFWLPQHAEWHWIHDEEEKSHEMERDFEWIIFNLQQTGMRYFIEILNLN
jgi:hypothetical protein